MDMIKPDRVLPSALGLMVIYSTNQNRILELLSRFHGVKKSLKLGHKYAELIIGEELSVPIPDAHIEGFCGLGKVLVYGDIDGFDTELLNVFNVDEGTLDQIKLYKQTKKISRN